jgi:hypothetical protein
MQLKYTRGQLIGIKLQIGNNGVQLPHNVKDKINMNDIRIEIKTYRGCKSGATLKSRVTTRPISIDKKSNSNTIIKGIRHTVQHQVCNCPNKKIGIHKLATCTLLKSKRTYAQVVKGTSVPQLCNKRTNKMHYNAHQQHGDCHNRKHGVHSLATCTLRTNKTMYSSNSKVNKEVDIPNSNKWSTQRKPHKTTYNIHP